jgi:hypothetical protein
MQLPGVNASSSVYLLFSYHVEGAVDAWSDVEIITADQQKAVADVGALLKPSVVALRVASGASDEAERLATMALARFRVRDVVLDLRIMATSDAVLNGPAMRRRDSPIYREVFAGDNAGDITRARMRDEPELAALLMGRLDKVESFDGKAPVQTALADAIQKSVNARDAADAATLIENQAGNAELSARLNLRLALEKAYGLLRAAFPGRRDFVESFFPKVERAAAKGGESSGGGSPPKDGAGG